MDIDQPVSCLVVLVLVVWFGRGFSVCELCWVSGGLIWRDGVGRGRRGGEGKGGREGRREREYDECGCVRKEGGVKKRE